ncbi:MAG: glycosyltransferase family 2 protein [Lachnospiraceae bacterium]|nr:glycosyltransferase family 2 protein [Lachnospiraceae bacterium]
MLSVVVPAFNEEDMVCRAANAISDQLIQAGIDYELLFIDDGSTDTTWVQICEYAERDTRIRGFHFSRNFGKESAIFAGLEQAEGDCVVVIDCDLQHPPEKIVEMYELWEEGYEIVEGIKADRGEESRFHSFAAVCFYRIISKAVQVDMEKASDFKLLDRKAVNVLLNMRERSAFFRALSSWIGFETATVEFEVARREEGTTKWTTWSLMKYAVSNITSFSSAPMQIVTVFGGMMLLFSIILGAIALFQKAEGIALEGFTTVIIIQLFTGSLIMISLGMIGYYIAKIYDEMKGRPRYIISKKCGFDK